MLHMERRSNAEASIAVITVDLWNPYLKFLAILGNSAVNTWL